VDSVLLQQIFLPQLFELKRGRLTQYLVRVESFCNIYEAGGGVKHYFTHTSPLMA